MRPPADPSAAPVPHAPTLCELTALLAEVKAVLAAAKTSAPLLIDQADVPAFLGVSRSCWFRWRSEGIAPRPVQASGAGVKFKRAELEKFVERMRTT